VNGSGHHIDISSSSSLGVGHHKRRINPHHHLIRRRSRPNTNPSVPPLKRSPDKIKSSLECLSCGVSGCSFSRWSCCWFSVYQDPTWAPTSRMVVEGPARLGWVPRPRESRAFWGAGRPGWSGCPGRGLFRFGIAFGLGRYRSTSRFGAENVELFCFGLF